MNKLYLFALSIFVLTACTTQKKRSDQSPLSKAWHNMNAQYNGYFNANEIIDEATLLLNEQHEDNYLERLDIYEYTEVENPQAVAEQLDEAIKKVTVVVNIHPYSNWTDDCYLLAGKAMYLKQDYETAEKSFRFLLEEYPPEEEETSNKKGAKSKGKKKSSSSAKSSSSSKSKAKTKKQREKERRAYNKEVAKKKRQREKDRRKGTTSASKPSPKTEKPAETPTEETSPTPVKEVAEDAPVGMVRLSDNDLGQVDADPENYNLKHRPAFQEGQLWLARTLIERDNYNDARRILSSLEQAPNTFKDVRAEVATAQAHLAIKEKDYQLATTYLANAIDRSNDRLFKARLAFIQAQLHQELSQASEAYAAFEQVVKFKPNYEMEFAARLSMAQNAYKAGGGNVEQAIANLERLLKDEKNKAYQDQIYFALAKIALDQGKQEEGLGLMQQCLSASTSNRALKAEAYYYLGTLFYDKEEYLSAKLYYDSTLMLMPQIDPRYLPAEKLRGSLVDIAANLETIQLNDSLLVVADWTDEQKEELAQKIFVEQQQAKQASSRGGSSRSKFGTPGTRIDGGPATDIRQTASNFWAYDDKVLKRGAKEFSRRWGTRGLVDNWRRSNDLGIGGEEEEISIDDISLLTQEQIDKILADVPKSKGEKRKLELGIKKAMFELGRLYRDRLENNEKCVEILEELNERFPTNLHELDSWYYLYLAHSDLNNHAKAKEYKDKIIQKYPTSNYGQILLNPNYAQEQMDEEFKMNKTYDDVYALFENNQHEQVIAQSEANINRIIGQHPLKPRYALLMAMSTGSVKGKEAYVLELQKLISSYKGSPEEVRAKEILRLLGEEGASLPGGEKEDMGDFSVNDDELHYILIVFESDEINLNANKVQLADYNKTYHSLDRIRISNVYLGKENNVPVLVMRRFKDKAKAMEYYDNTQKNAKDFIDPAGNNAYKVYPISQSNYREVLRNRSVDGYDDFFSRNY